MRVTATEAKNRFGSLCARGDPSMVRYDVFPNPSASARNGIPYVVVIQSELLDTLSTRLTVPLATLAFAGKASTALCPTITVKGERLNALAHYAAPLPSKALRRPVDNVVAHASALAAAMDVALSGV